MKRRFSHKKHGHIIIGVLSVLAVVLFAVGLVFGVLYWDFRSYTISADNNAFERVKSSSCSATKNQDVHIAYITDANYIYPTQVSVFSAIQNKCPKSTYYFHIITDNVPTEDVQKAFEPLAREDVHFNIVPQKKVLDIEFSDYLEHISAAALLKFMIPEALGDVSRVIYFDSDTLVKKDLQELYNTDLGDNMMGAVADVSMSIQRSYLRKIGYNDKHYFNAGMLLLDLDKLREKGIPAQLNEYVSKHPNLLYIDQDAYNMVLEHKIKRLPYKYNCMPSVHLSIRQQLSFSDYLKHRFRGESTIKSSFVRLNKDEFPLLYRNMFDDVVVFHYFGYAKPWRGPVMNAQVKVYFNMWQKYAQKLAEEYGITKKEIIFKLPRKKDHKKDNKANNKADKKKKH